MNHSWIRQLSVKAVFLALGWLLAASVAGNGQDPKPLAPPSSLSMGIPFIRNFAPREYRAQPQNWAIVQDRRGVIYLGNGDGILEYDGTTWRLIPTRNRTCVRSLAMDAQGRIYVGAQGEIGYLAPDKTGQMAFVSLNDRIAPEDLAFGDVWRAYATSRGVFFSSYGRVFRFSQGRFRAWRPSTTFHLSFFAGERFFVREVDRGLMELVGETLQLIPAGERFAQEKVLAVLPWEEPGTKDRERLLVATRSQGLFTYDGAGFTPWRTEADAYLREHPIYRGSVLADGTLALPTLQGGIVILDRQGRILQILDKRSGLQDETVYFLDQDRQGGLWAALENGISRVETPSPLTRFDESSGLKGAVMSLVRHDGALCVGTSTGIFREAVAGRSDSKFVPRFRSIPGITGQTWGFLEMDGALLAANNQGVYELKGDQARLIRPSPVNTGCLHRSSVDPSRVWVGLQDGLASLRRIGNTWEDEGKVPGPVEQIRSIFEDSDGSLWLGTRIRGVLRVRFSNGCRAPPQVDQFGTEQGLPAMIDTEVIKIQGAPCFATQKGLYRFDTTTGRFGPDARFGQLFPGGPRAVHVGREDDAGRIWMHTINEAQGKRESGVALPQRDGSYRWEKAPFLRFEETAFEVIHPEPNGLVWFGGSDGLFRYDPRVPKEYAQDFQVLLRRVTRKGNQILFDGARGDAVPKPALKYRENSIRFEFAAPSYDLESANRYQFLLEGYDSAWSPWTGEPFKEYTNLPERNYRFRVRAVNIYGQVSREDMYAFRVLPPWYRTGWAYLLYLAFSSFTLWAIYRARTRILRERNRELQAQIGDATLELQTQAVDLERMNGELRLLNEQKNQFFGIVTHDLRNPLNGIVIEAQLIDGEEDLQGIYHSARNIQREGLEMSALIGRFLDIAAIESGGIKTEKAPFDLWAVAAHLVERHTARAREKGIEIKLEPLEGNGTVLADLKYTKEVLDNLISNAVKFSPPGKAVGVRVEGDRKKVLVSVQDQGPGLTGEDKARLFGRFARLTAQPTGGEKSTGLGLSIVKHLVEAMEGRIWVDSEPGRGAVFHVQLPTASAMLPEAIQHPDLTQEMPSSPPAAGPSRPVPAQVSNGASPIRIFQGRVLLADDNPNNRKIEEALLRRLGIEVVGVEDGVQALEALEREPFDVVFLDGRMPRLDGPGTVSEIRRRESTGVFFGGRRQVVVALTALADSMGRESFLAAGFDELLSKPLEMAALQEVLDRFLDQPTEPGTRMKARHMDSWEALEAVLGGPQAFAEFLAEVLNDADARLARLQSAFERMDRGQIARDAHDLKSNAATLGLKALAKVCSELEHGAMDMAPEELRARIARLPDLLEALRSKCRDYLRN